MDGNVSLYSGISIVNKMFDNSSICNLFTSHLLQIGYSGASVTSTTAGVVDLTWTDNSGAGKLKAKSTDKALLLVYNATKNIAIYDLEGASRDSEGQTLAMPADFSGDDVEAFIGFISEDVKEIANSVYIGSVTVV